jgi:hypothetical protein
MISLPASIARQLVFTHHIRCCGGDNSVRRLIFISFRVEAGSRQSDPATSVEAVSAIDLLGAALGRRFVEASRPFAEQR